MQNLAVLLQILLAPLPLAVFIAYVSWQPVDKNNLRPYSGAILGAMIFFAIGIGCIVAISHLLNMIQLKQLKIAFPLFINSLVISLYVVNYYYVRSIVLAGSLSGISFGAVLYFVFFMEI
ncbi:hypothetical protein TI04_08700 [Achromatium sp. WMS2]|nr:hypothetical protein TI04_08700 [Achromatium sp. WMS2]